MSLIYFFGNSVAWFSSTNFAYDHTGSERMSLWGSWAFQNLYGHSKTQNIDTDHYERASFCLPFLCYYNQKLINLNRAMLTLVHGFRSSCPSLVGSVALHLWWLGHWGGGSVAEDSCPRHSWEEKANIHFMVMMWDSLLYTMSMFY